MSETRVPSTASDAYQRDRDKLRAEVEQLRGALHEIAQECGICDYGLPGPCTCCRNPVQVARGVLNNLPECRTCGSTDIYYGSDFERCLDCGDIDALRRKANR